MGLYAIKNIKLGDEITISYGPKTSHERDFECTCGKELPEREKLFDIICHVGNYYVIKNEKILESTIYDYLQTKLSKLMLMNHYLVTKGIYLSGNTVSRMTMEGGAMINEVVNSHYDLADEENSLITEQKINLFMHVIRLI
jgi:hypothetical protein